MKATEQIRSGFEHLRSIPFALFGVCFYRAWLNSSIPLFTSAQAFGNSGRIVFDLTCAITALAFALIGLRWKKESRLNRKTVSLAATILMCISSLVLFAGEYRYWDAPFQACWVIAGGIGLMSLSMLWIEQYASLNPVKMVTCYTGALILGELLSYILTGYRTEWMPFVLVSSALASFACYNSTQKPLAEKAVVQPKKNGKPSASIPWKLSLLIASYAFAYAMSDAGLDSSISYPLRMVSAIPLLVAFLSVLLDAKRFTLERIFVFALPTMVCGFLLISLFPGVSSETSSALTSVGYAAASLIVVVVVCGISYRTGASALFLFGITRAMQYFGMTAGMGVRYYLNSHVAAESQFLDAIVATAVIVAVMLASLLFVLERKEFFGWGVAANAPDETANTSSLETNAMRVEYLGSVHRLTQREIEVLHLISRGCGTGDIANDLFIAKGTAKAHIQHVYTKLDVHSKQELFALLQNTRR